jgi:Ferritin-like
MKLPVVGRMGMHMTEPPSARPPERLDTAVHVTLQAVEAPHEPDIVIGSREQLLYLLAEAAEIEHTLMCSYLYAAFSLKPATASGLWAREAEAVERWRQTIMGVAIEEMGHVLMVSNLLVAIGGRPHFTRPNFPVSPGYFPSGVVLRLTPFAVETLEHFIFLERPTGVERADGEGFEHLAHARTQAHRGLMPSAQDYATVSHLYEAIRTNLVALVERAGPDALFVGPASGQIGPELVTMPGIEAITSLDSAGRALDLIVEQGEGSPADREESHYRRFLGITREYAAILAAHAEFAPAYPVAANPVMRRPPEPAGHVWITAEPAAMVLDFANASYGMLVRLLTQAYAAPGPDAAADKALLMSAAVELMHVLAKAATALVTLPASPEHPGIHAGMTFTMLRGVEPFAGAAARLLIVERLRQLATGARHAGRRVPAIAALGDTLDTVAGQLSTRR